MEYRNQDGDVKILRDLFAGFGAILLAVTDEYRKTKPDKRQQLHFNGVGGGQLSPPYVEIVFDNTDSRLPVRIFYYSLP